MGSEETGAVLMLTLAAVPMMVLCIPMILGKVARNAFYGFRTSATLATDRVWYPANRAAGWAMLIAGGTQVGTGLLTLLGLLPFGVVGMLVVMTVSVAAACVYSFLALRRIKANVPRELLEERE